MSGPGPSDRSDPACVRRAADRVSRPVPSPWPTNGPIRPVSFARRSAGYVATSADARWPATGREVR